MTLPQCETAGLSRFYFGNSADSRRNCPLLAVQAFVILHGLLLELLDSCQSIIWPDISNLRLQHGSGGYPVERRRHAVAVRQPARS